jgi:hypothetical protein
MDVIEYYAFPKLEGRSHIIEHEVATLHVTSRCAEEIRLISIPRTKCTLEKWRCIRGMKSNSGEFWYRSQVVRTCSIINSPDYRKTMLRYFINDNNVIIIMSLLCYVVKHLFKIPQILVVWRRTTSQTVAFVTGKVSWIHEKVRPVLRADAT